MLLAHQTSSLHVHLLVGQEALKLWLQAAIVETARHGCAHFVQLNAGEDGRQSRDRT